MSRKRDAQEAGEQDLAHQPRRSKKPRTYTPGDAQLAKHYEDLASELNDVRIQAATSLINNVKTRLSEEDDSSASPLESQRRIVVRLVRGLCSSRKAARMGFSIALTELFRIVLADSTEILVQAAVTLVEEHTSPEGGASAQEKRDYALGRLTAYSTILRSGVLQTGKESEQTTRLVVGKIFGIYTDIPWLREECGVVLGEAVLAADEANHAFVRTIIESLVASGHARSPEGIVLWLSALSRDVEKLPKHVWHHRDPLHAKELSSVFKIIKQNESEVNAAKDATKSASQSGARRHSPHYAWNEVLRLICARADHKLFEQYWTETFDHNFFGKSASPEKKALGFQNFVKVIAWVPEKYMDVVFSASLVKSLINQSSQAQRYLHAAAKSALAAVVARAKVSEAGDVLAIFEQLLLGHGTLSFDKITGTKTFQEILSAIDGVTLFTVVDGFYRSLLTSVASSGKDSSMPKTQAVGDHFLSLVRSRNLADETVDFDTPHWLLCLLNTLASHAFKNNVLNDDGISTLRSRLFSILGHIMASSAENRLEYPAWLVQTLLSGSEELLVFKGCDDAVREKLEEAIITFEKLIAIPSLETSEEDIPERRVLRLLFSMTLLQAFASETDAIELLTDLQQCYKDVLGRKGQKKRGTEVIMDIIMDFASRQSALYRTLAEQAFAGFAPDLTADSLQSMLKVLEQKESVAGQQALFDQNDAADDAEEGSEVTGSADEGSDQSNESDDSEDDDVEIVHAGSDVEEVNGDATDSSEEESDEDADQGGEDDNDKDEDELAKFDALLASTLKTNDTGDASDSDADMDDDEMMALEPHLAAIFRDRAAAASKDGKVSQKKAEQRSAKENITAFKNRVLDLLLVYVRQCADQCLAVELILPLLQLIRTSTSKQVADKAHHLLKTYFDLAKKKGWGSDVAVPRMASAADESSQTAFLALEARLDAIHDEALRFGGKAHAAACSSASLFVARAALVLWQPADDTDPTTSDMEPTTNAPATATAAALLMLSCRYAHTHARRLAQPAAVTGTGALPASFWEEWVRWSLDAHRRLGAAA